MVKCVVVSAYANRLNAKVDFMQKKNKNSSVPKSVICENEYYLYNYI